MENFGCEKCYENFESKINNILKNIHGIDTHSGRVGKNLIELNGNSKEEKVNKVNNKEDNKGKDENTTQIENLKERLEKEVKEERYEDAAKTRDEIKKLEK